MSHSNNGGEKEKKADHSHLYTIECMHSRRSESMNKTEIMVINLGMVRAIINVDQTLYEAKSMYFSKTDTLQCVHIRIITQGCKLPLI